MLFLALRNQATFRQRELYLMVLIGSAGYTVNYFVSHNNRFGSRADFSSALGCFAVGFLGNVYSRFTNGNGFAVMAPGVLFQLPSGLSASGGLLSYANTNTSSGQSDYQFASERLLIRCLPPCYHTESLQSASQNIGQTLSAFFWCRFGSGKAQLLIWVALCSLYCHRHYRGLVLRFGIGQPSVRKHPETSCFLCIVRPISFH